VCNIFYRYDRQQSCAQFVQLHEQHGATRSWLRHYATSRKVAGLSPGEVDFFNLPNPFSRTVALGSTKPLTEISTRNLHGGKGGRHVGLTTLSPSVCRMSENVGTSTSRNPNGLHGLYMGKLYLYLYTNRGQP
jgi:hypothetical protein